MRVIRIKTDKDAPTGPRRQGKKESPARIRLDIKGVKKHRKGGTGIRPASCLHRGKCLVDCRR